jgi:hypothetical protein
MASLQPPNKRKAMISCLGQRKKRIRTATASDLKDGTTARGASHLILPPGTLFRLLSVEISMPSR